MTKNQNSLKFNFKLFYKIFILTAAINLLVISTLLYSTIKDYKIEKYKELLKRSSSIFDFVIQNFQTRAMTGTGNAKTLKPRETIALFARVLPKDEIISHLYFYDVSAKNLYLYKDIADLRETEIKRIASIELSLKQKIYFLLYDEEKNMINHYYKLIDNADNYIGILSIGVKTNLVVEGIRSMIWDAMLLGFISLSAGLIIAYCFAKYLLKPVQSLRKTANKIAAGDLTKRADIISNDEIGELSLQFNNMTGKLEEKINNLNMLQMLSMKISSRINRDELSNIIVHTFSNYFAAEKCALLIPDFTINKFTITAAVGVSDSSITLSFTEGLLGKVCSTWKIEWTKDLSSMPEIKLFYNNTSPENSTCYMGIPLVLNDTLRAIILIIGKKAELNNDNKPIIELLASQSMTALENSRLYEMAITDGLTGVFLKRHFLQKLDEYIYFSDNFKSIALCMIDIDFFKKFNDSFGHQEGDVILKEVAKTLKNSIRGFDLKKAEREPDMVARYGGEEFTIILFNLQDGTLPQILERIRNNIDSNEFQGEKQIHHVTISIGACFFQKGMTGAQLIEFADNSLYDAKHSGRNCFKIHTFN
ncbi:MAG TPA: diguanylate cyclase [bacterium]|nr:diguanylate cyclase [bacterium]HPN30474.1 diguanylate cyclase [bacterium]